jgi:propanol-preferring alcohol dehydrogenase
MKAVRLTAIGPISGNPIEITDVAVPEIGSGQILIQVVACGVCRSNLHMIEGDWVDGGVPGMVPITPGHEVTGIVAAVADDVEGFPIGARVGVQPLWWTCETCDFCLSGREELCRERRITGEHVDGGYADYMVSNAAHTYLVPDGLDLAEAAPLFCPGITAFGALSKLDLGPGKTVAIFGVGGVGHMAIQFAQLTGADVIAVTRNPAHLEVAEGFGVSRVINSSLVDPGLLLESEGGIDAALVFAPSSAVAAQAIRALKPGGTVVIGVIVDIEGFSFATGKTVIASILGSRAQMRQVLRLAAEGKVRSVVETSPTVSALSVLRRLVTSDVRARAVLVN